MASNFCRNCGFRITPGKMFCGNCGTVVSTAPAQVPVMPVAVPIVATPVLTPVYSVPSAAPAAPAVPAAPVAPVAPAAPAAPVAPAAPAVPVAPVVPAAPAVPAAPVAPAVSEAAPAPAVPVQVPAAAPVEEPAVPASVTEAPADEPASPAPAVLSESADEPVISVNPQPMQTVVTYHPVESVTEQLPAEALLPAVPVQETLPEVATAPAAPEVPAVPAVPAAAPAAAPVEPASACAPAVPAAPKKKKHTGLIVGLICGGAAVVLILVTIAVATFFAFRAKKGSTILERIEVRDEASSGMGYTIYNKDFDKKIESARWWDYDGTMKSQGVYNDSTETLAFSIKVDEKSSEKLYFAFYYSKDDDFDKEDLEKPVFSDKIAPSYYKDGTAYYNIECSGSLKPGFYCVIIGKDKSLEKPYAVAYAKIVEREE